MLPNPDADAGFYRALAEKLAVLILAHEIGDAEAAVAALKALLTTITERTARGSRRDAALVRAITELRR